MITPSLYRVNSPDMSCTECLDRLTDPALAHDGGEDHPMHERCWQKIAEENPDRLMQEGTAACPKCHTFVNAETLFPWQRIALHMLRGGVVGIRNGVEGALEISLSFTAANALRKAAILKSQTIGDLRSLLALSFAAFCAKALLTEHADNPAPSVSRALMTSLAAFIFVRSILAAVSNEEFLVDLSTTVAGVIGVALLQMFCKEEGRIAPLWQAIHFAILCLGSAFGRTIEFSRETSPIQTTLVEIANIAPLALFGLAFLDLCSKTRTTAAATAGFALGWLWEWSRFSLMPPVPVLD